MDKLDKLYKVLSNIDTFSLLQEIIQTPKISTWILTANKMQLYEDGEDALGRQLGEYAPSTIMDKLASPERDHRVDHITLKDYGDFYSSFLLEAETTYFEIMAETEKGDGTDLMDKFGEDILGLNESNKKLLWEKLKEEMIKYIRNKLIIEVA